MLRAVVPGRGDGISSALLSAFRCRGQDGIDRRIPSVASPILVSRRASTVRRVRIPIPIAPWRRPTPRCGFPNGGKISPDERTRIRYACASLFVLSGRQETRQVPLQAAVAVMPQRKLPGCGPGRLQRSGWLGRAGRSGADAWLGPAALRPREALAGLAERGIWDLFRCPIAL
jgi:hypothetical protein